MAQSATKFVISQLSQEPFNLDLNVIAFNKLQPTQLLQLLSDVVCEIEGKDRIQVSGETAEQLAVRLLFALQIFKYQPQIQDPDVFRQNLMSAQFDLIVHILSWLLEWREDLKKRAYLSRFLVRVEIAPEVRTDSDVADLYDQYLQLMEEFKQVHKQWDSSKNVNDTVSELRKDLQVMQDDHDVLTRRIERVQRKVENVANYQQLMTAARRLRAEKEKQRQIQAQKTEQKSSFEMLDSKKQHLQQQLVEIRQVNSTATAKSIVQRLHDTIRVNRYMTEDKLPKEIENRARAIGMLNNALKSANPKVEDIQEIKQKIAKASNEVTSLTEKRALQQDPTEDGMALYRQQALIVARKKESVAERLNETHQELLTVENEIKVKNQLMQDIGVNPVVLSSDKFKLYVSELRTKSNLYKKNRAELNDLKTEYGILSRTLEILQAQEASQSEKLNLMEIQQGVRGFRQVKEELEGVSNEKAATDEIKSRTLEEMSAMVITLNSKINERKAKLAPLLRELRPLRQKYQESLPEYEARKRTYETEVRAIENSVTSVASVTSTLENETKQLDERCDKLQLQIRQNQDFLQRAKDEMKLYVQSDKSKTVRDKLQHRIAELEKQNVQIRDEYRNVKDNLPQLEKQMEYWQKIARVFQAKVLCLERDNKQQGTVRRERGRETLVLQ